jgi:AraC-like DNA-binding protein
MVRNSGRALSGGRGADNHSAAGASALVWLERRHPMGDLVPARDRPRPAATCRNLPQPAATCRNLPESLTAAGMTGAHPSDVYRVAALIAEVLQSMERDTTTASLLAAAGAAWHLMALPASDRSTGDGRYAAIDRAAEYLRTDIDDHVSVAELAAMSRLSGSHFAGLFKNRIGYPTLQHQTQLRMARTRKLLDTTDQSIAAVAAAPATPTASTSLGSSRRCTG